MIRLYPNVVVKPQSFKGVKKCVVPNQSMSLAEILRRFIKREALPVARQGIYEERFGDLEKLSHADISIQMERVEEIKADLALIELRAKQRIEKEKAAAATVPPIVPAQGVEPVKSPPLQGS